MKLFFDTIEEVWWCLSLSNMLDLLSCKSSERLLKALACSVALSAICWTADVWWISNQAVFRASAESVFLKKKCISSCLPAVLLKKNLQLGLFMTARRKCYKHTNICAHRHTPSRRAARWCANDPVLNRRGRGAFAACWMDSSRRLPQERFLFTACNQTQRAAVQIRQSRQKPNWKTCFFHKRLWF